MGELFLPRSVRQRIFPVTSNVHFSERREGLPLDRTRGLVGEVLNAKVCDFLKASLVLGLRTILLLLVLMERGASSVDLQ